MTGLSRDSSHRIGFVVAALMTGTIDCAEVRAWAEHVLATSDDYPSWIIDLIEFDGSPAHIYKIIGFAPSSGLSPGQYLALAGIALRRGRGIDETVSNPSAALSAMEKHPEVLERLLTEIPSLTMS